MLDVKKLIRCLNTKQVDPNRQVITPQEILNVSRVYAYVNQGEYRYFDDHSPDQGNYDDYEFNDQIGQGGFSLVFAGKRNSDGTPVVLKQMKLSQPKLLNREIAILESLRNSSKHIVNMIDVIKRVNNDTATLVFSFIESISLQKSIPQFSMEDIKFYLFQLLLALDESHSRGIMHRDVKISNVIINEEQRRLILIDWGQGEYYHAGQNYTTHVGTPFYKAPELLVGYKYYDYAVDMWSVGCILGHLIYKRYPFFKGKDDNEVLQKITTILGTNDLYRYLNKYHLRMTPEQDDMMVPLRKRSWESLFNSENDGFETDEGLDLISKLLVYDHRIRLTAKETMAHAFFDTVRQQFNN